MANKRQLKKYVGQFEDAELGLQGLLAKGYTPKQAQEIIVENGRKEGTAEIFVELRNTPDGQKLIDQARAEWAKYGVESPVEVYLREYDQAQNKAVEKVE